MVLEEIKKILEKEEFDCSLSKAQGEIPFDRLLVFLGLDIKGRERILEVISNEQHLSPEFIQSKPPILPYRIQFRIRLPFKVEDLALHQVASLLLFLNQFIDLPGFELDELKGEVFYRYVWIIHPSSIDAISIQSIVGAIIMNLGLFSETIESLAEGKTSFNDLLSQIIQTIQPSHSKKNI